LWKTRVAVGQADYGQVVRWDKLFDDLEAQLAHEARAEQLDLGAEEERLRLGRLGLRDRIMTLTAAAASVSIMLTLSNGDRLAVRPSAYGQDWMMADLVTRVGQCVVPLSAISGVSLTVAQVALSLGAPSPRRALADRIGLTVVLRDLCRRRHPVELIVRGGSLRGTIDRVGRDHLDVALHEPGTARRDDVVSEVRLVPFDALVLVVI